MVMFLVEVAPNRAVSRDYLGPMHLLYTVSHIGPTLCVDEEGPSALATGLTLDPMALQVPKGSLIVAANSVARPQRVAPPEGM